MHNTIYLRFYLTLHGAHTVVNHCPFIVMWLTWFTFHILEQSSWEYANSLVFYGSLWKQICCGGHCYTDAACVIICEVSILQHLGKNSLHLLYLQHSILLSWYRIHDGGLYCSWDCPVRMRERSVNSTEFTQSSEFFNSKDYDSASAQTDIMIAMALFYPWTSNLKYCRGSLRIFCDFISQGT